MSRWSCLAMLALALASCDALAGVLEAQVSIPDQDKILGTSRIPSSYVPHMTRFSDRSVSWNQPSSSLLGYNGYCGHTAWANAVTMYTGRKYDPSYFHYFSSGDLTPGLRPATLTDALNQATHEQHGIKWHLQRFPAAKAWSRLKAALTQSYFGTAHTPLPVVGLVNSPVLVVIQTSPSTYHWITVVGYREYDDYESSYVIANDRGSQRRIPLPEFMDSWSFGRSDDRVTSWLRTSSYLGSFTAIIPAS